MVQTQLETDQARLQTRATARYTPPLMERDGRDGSRLEVGWTFKILEHCNFHSVHIKLKPISDTMYHCIFYIAVCLN